MSHTINQKEYLQKYLSSDDKLLRKKKKKKKDKDKEKSIVKHSTVTIIDDDDHAKFDPDPDIDEGELYALNEEAPQIVGVIDERAPEVLMKQEYLDSGKWKTLASSRKSKKTRNNKSPSIEIVGSRKSGTEVIQLDLSPPRRNRGHSSDNTSERKRTTRRNSDESPPRRSKIKRESPDVSPPRQSRKRYNEDASPPRRRRRSSDESPPRKSHRKVEESSHRSRHRSPSPPRRIKDESPNRKPRRDENRSPSRRSSQDRKRKSRWASKSPTRSDRNEHDSSPPRKIKIEQDSSPPRRRVESPRVKEEINSPPRNTKMAKTLDGKAAGLQNAKDLKVENEAYRRRQKDLYRKLDPSLSGRHAKDVAVRDVRGRNREFAKNYDRDRKKAEEEEIRKQQYDKWSKGIKQLQEIERRREEIAHEASKPLARAADDKDLEDHLKTQERLEDPMLEYIRSKKKKNDKKAGVLERPQYQGQFPDNRFHIRPGYRWDGVDRSNGYEKKYFEMISAKQSTAEEAYKYSVEDM